MQVDVLTQDELQQRLGQLLSPRTVIVCMGSELHGDDGVGVAIGRQLADQVPWPVFEVSLAPESFVVKVADCQPNLVILIDAADVGASPGAVLLTDADSLANLSPSTHGPGLKMFLEALRLMHACRVVMLGIQPANTETGQPLSATAAEAARQIVEAFQLACQHLTAGGSDPPPTEQKVSRSVPLESRAHDELEAVSAISRALAGRLELDEVLAVAVSVVADVIGAEGSSILLIDADTKVMSFHVAAGPGADAAKSVPLPPNAGICGHVAATGEPLIVNDAQDDPRLYRRVDDATGFTTRNLLCVPLVGSERLEGVLELINKHAQADFDERDLRIAQAVGGQIALALENARLHDDLLRKERLATVGRTVSGLAHCVKNVLNGIRSGSAVVDRRLREGDLAKVHEGWQVVRKNNDMLGNLVLDMLSLARDSTIHPFPTDVNDLADQICRLVRDRAAERAIEVGFSPAEGLGEVMLDTTQLYRCLLNLVSNAIDACDDGGAVRVRAHRGDGRPRLTLSVADNGSGIAPEHRAKLFGEFFTTKGNGTGLGLPVTKKLITAMNGEITFHSVVGHGTKFVIALPIDDAPPE